MFNNYIDTLEEIETKVLFFLFKYSVIVLSFILIISLILLIIGCLIKSQKIRMRFISISIFLIITLIILLIIPIIIYKLR